MFIPSYLSISRHGIYYYRLPLPTQLAQPRTCVKLSLGTREPKEALRLARTMTNLGEFLFSLNPALKTMDYAELKPFIQNILSDALTKFRERIDKTGPISDQPLKSLHDGLSLANDAIDTKDYTMWFPSVGKTVEKLVQDNGISDRVTEENREQLKWLYVQASKTYCDEAIQYNSDAAAVKLAEGSYIPAQIKTVKAKHIFPLSISIGEYLQEKRGWSTSTKEERIAQLDYLIEMLGEDFNVGDMDFAVANRVKQQLLTTPRNRKKKELSGKSDFIPPLSDTLAPRSVNNYLGCYISFITWAKNHGKCSSNPFTGMKVSVKGEKKKKRAFTLEEMSKIISTLEEMRANGTILAHHYWVGMISIYSGCRVNEAASLYKKNIVESITSPAARGMTLRQPFAYSVISLSLRGHPVEFVRSSLDKMSITPLKHLKGVPNKWKVKVAGLPYHQAEAGNCGRYLLYDDRR